MIKTIIDIITDENFIGAILTSLFFIFLGFILTRKKIIDSKGKNFLSFLVLKIALPAMAFSAFMSDFQSADFVKHIMVFLISLFLYILFLIICQIFLIGQDKNRRRVIAILMVVGQLTFFAIPVLKTIYVGNYSEVMIPANMMTLSFRFVLYLYCYFTISKLSFSKAELRKTIKNIFLNPVMIAMFVGLFIWLTQNISFMPKIIRDDKSYSFLRIDQSLPSLFIVITKAESLTTPLAMVIIGTILGEAKIMEALKDKLSWLITIIKTLVVPISALLIIVLLQAIKVIHFSEYELSVIVLGLAAPLSAVVSTYCYKYDNEAALSSRVCFLSTILCIFTYPFLFIMIKLFLQLPIFN